MTDREGKGGLLTTEQLAKHIKQSKVYFYKERPVPKPRSVFGDELNVLNEALESRGGLTLALGNAQFCGNREPLCLRHIVHWHMPFCIIVSDKSC